MYQPLGVLHRLVIAKLGRVTGEGPCRRIQGVLRQRCVPRGIAPQALHDLPGCGLHRARHPRGCS